MSPERVLTAIYDDLQAEASASSWRADIYIGDGLLDALQLLTDAPARRRVVIHWRGDEQAGNVAFIPVTAHQVDVYVSAPEGLAVDRTAAVRNVDGGSLVGFVNTVRAQILSAVWTPVEGAGGELPQYQGTEEVSLPDGMPLDAYRISIAIPLANVSRGTGHAITIPDEA